MNDVLLTIMRARLIKDATHGCADLARTGNATTPIADQDDSGIIGDRHWRSRPRGEVTFSSKKTNPRRYATPCPTNVGDREFFKETPRVIDIDIDPDQFIICHGN